MQKTYTKAILGTLVLIGGALSPYSFFQHEHKGIESSTTIHTANMRVNIVYAEQCGGKDMTADQICENGVIKNKPAAAITPTDKEIAGTLEAFLKVVYVLLWPLLWIAGRAMDNSLVYGEIFGLDQALFKFWQIMKNFANFALGFLFVWSIVKYILNPSEKKHPKDLIAKLLVAGIGVQLSWFIMGALVDLSSVLTIGLGGLPLNLIDQENIGKKPIFGVVTKIKLNDAIGSTDGSPILYRWPGSNLSAGNEEKFLLPCLFNNSKIDWSENWQVAFGVKDTGGNTINNGNISGTNVSWNQINDKYCIASNNLISKNVITNDPYKNSSFTDGGPDVSKIIDASLAEANTTLGCANQACQTMGTFTKRAGGFQGAFYSLYTSLLSLSTIHVGVPKSNTSLVMETLIKTVVGLAYLIPLAILCIVLIMRVGYLWLIIAFSPFIILAEVKDLGIGGLKDGVKVIGKTAFNAKNVISLLLLPVVVTFAVSLSIVFLGSLSDGLSKDGSQQALGIYSREEGSYKCYDIVLTDICLDIPKNNIGTGIFDYFSWIIMNLFGIGMMRFIVMAALKSSELTKGVAEGVEKLSGSILQSAPIIPIGGGTSFKSISDLPGQITQDIQGAQAIESKELSNFITGKEKQDAAKKKKDDDKVATDKAKIATAAPAVSSPSLMPDQIKGVSTALNASAPTNTSTDVERAAFANKIATQAGQTSPKYKDFNELVKDKPELFGQLIAHDATAEQRINTLAGGADKISKETQEAINKAKEAEKKIIEINKSKTTVSGSNEAKPLGKVITKNKEGIEQTFSLKTGDPKILTISIGGAAPVDFTIPQPGKGNEHDITVLNQYVSYVNEIGEENYDKLGGDTWKQLADGSTHTYMVKSADGKPAIAHILEEKAGLKVELVIKPKNPPK